MTTDYRALIGALDARHVDFVVIGAIAMVLHGSARVTRDLDICYSRESANLKALAASLKPFTPTLRGAPPNLPFTLDAHTLRSGLNFTLTCAAGDIDLMGEVVGIGGFAVVKRLSEPMTVYDRPIHVLSLDGLERAKRAAGRLKDLADLAEILELRKQQRRT